MCFPEKILKDLTDHFVEVTIDNYIYCRDNDCIEDSFLHDIFGELPDFNGHNIFENAVAIFSRDVDHPRRIETHIFFNRERFHLPTIHIGLPSEQVSETNGLGYDFGRFEDKFQPSDPFMQATTHSRMFQAKYNIAFTSDNTNEVLIMYNWFRACMIGNIELFELNGLHNPVISGSDIILNDALAPSHIYSRALMIDCQYEITAPNFNKYQISSKVKFEGTPID